MAILRGMGVKRSLAVAQRAWDLGITSVEIPIQSSEDLVALRAVVDAGRTRGMAVGAGTVLTVEHVQQAIDCGASFVVSPGMNQVVAQRCIESGLPQLPGVATATEIQTALSLGLPWVKAFPASVLGPDWIKAMAGPFPHIKVVATGGIDAFNSEDYLAAGAKVVAVGSALEDPVQLDLLGRKILGSFDTPQRHLRDSTHGD